MQLISKARLSHNKDWVLDFGAPIGCFHYKKYLHKANHNYSEENKAFYERSALPTNLDFSVVCSCTSYNCTSRSKCTKCVQVGRSERLNLKYKSALIWSFQRGSHQSLFDEQTEENGIAHLPQTLKHIGLELSVLNDVLQLMVEELQDA